MKTIEVTITKEDIENQKGYTNSTGCLLFTALKRMGHPIRCVTPGFVYMHESTYGIERKDINDLAGDDYPNFEGRTFVLTKCKDEE